MGFEKNNEGRDNEKDESELRSLCGSDEEEKDNFQEFNLDTDMSNPMFAFGILLSCAKDLRDAIREYGIKNHKIEVQGK